MSKFFEPKKSKYKKYFRAKTILRIDKNLTPTPLLTSSVGLKVLSFGCISSVQFQAIKQSINKVIKKFGKCTFNAFPNRAKSVKKGGGRMGKGKGNLKTWIYCVRPGFILCVIKTPVTKVGIKALTTAQYRLGVRTSIISI